MKFLSVIFGVVVFGCSQLLAADPSKNAQPMDAAALAARIDGLIANSLQTKGIQPAAPADDAEFLRRVYLDLAGRIPSTWEVRDFLASKQSNKRQRIIDRLLDEPLYVTHLGTTWQSIMSPPNTNQQLQAISAGFKIWLDKQVKDNAPYDQMVRELLTAPVTGSPGGRGGQPLAGAATVSPAGFILLNENKPENVASSASRIFLGVKLECAQCHNHPFANWTREQFWEYAAFFAATPQAERGAVKGIKIAGTEKVVEAKFLDGQKPQWRNGVDARVVLSEWMTAPDNPYFARTAVNRLWAHCFGVGIIDPVDDEPSPDNPISHPELLTQLTEQFIAHKYDLKYMLRAIVLSQTYQRTSAVSHKSQLEPRTFARMPLRGLTPEQLFDSLAQATGYFETDENQPAARGDPNVSPRTEFLNRFANQDKPTQTQTSILQALALMNGKFIADATGVSAASKDPRGRASDRGQTLSAISEFPGWTTEQRIEALYLAALSRLPRPHERDRLSAYVNRGGAVGDPKEALGDVFWVLLNSAEFIVNH